MNFSAGLRSLLRKALHDCHVSTQVPKKEILVRCPTIQYHSDYIPCLACLTHFKNSKKVDLGCDQHRMGIKLYGEQEWLKDVESQLEL